MLGARGTEPREEEPWADVVVIGRPLLGKVRAPFTRTHTVNFGGEHPTRGWTVTPWKPTTAILLAALAVAGGIVLADCDTPSETPDIPWTRHVTVR